MTMLHMCDCDLSRGCKHIYYTRKQGWIWRLPFFIHPPKKKKTKKKRNVHSRQSQNSSWRGDFPQWTGSEASTLYANDVIAEHWWSTWTMNKIFSRVQYNNMSLSVHVTQPTCIITASTSWQRWWLMPDGDACTLAAVCEVSAHQLARTGGLGWCQTREDKCTEEKPLLQLTRIDQPFGIGDGRAWC